jgi:glycosyltransferase involved in cell wall biosynthesis
MPANKINDRVSISPKIWIIEVGEPLPIHGNRIRVMRAGQLAKQLARDGAEVTWWVSDFNHLVKGYYDLAGLSGEGRLKSLEKGISLYFLHGRPYRKNISISRILHNRDIAKDFQLTSVTLQPPDLIMCCYPTIDLADVVTEYGSKLGIPVVLDIRDLWPDVFVDVLPFPRWLSRLIVRPLVHKASRALRRANTISAISELILEWGLAKAGRSRSEGDRVFPLSYERTELSVDRRINAEQKWRTLGLKLDGSEPIVCCFGMLSHVPEFETILEALLLLPETLAQAIRVVICGAGPRLGWLQEASRVYPQLLVPGYVEIDAIESLMPYAFAGLLPYPTRSDLYCSYPNKIGEYLSAGLPVISTLGGSSAYLLNSRKCGIVVKNRDAKNFASALTQLANRDAAWQIMSENALNTYNDMFDAKSNYAKMSEYLIKMNNNRIA